MDIEGQYLTYEEYKGLGGTLDQTPFKILEFEARQNVDKYTFGRLKNLDEQIFETKMCVYKLIDKINSYKQTESSNKLISSENIDGYSVSYASPSREYEKTIELEYKNIVKDYLFDCVLEDGTPYLYCGRR